MKLYYTKGSCALAIRITIHELNIPCSFEAVNHKNKQTESGVNFFNINPKGMVPVLELNNGIFLTEIVAIQIYLAENNKGTHLLPATGDPNRYSVIEWLSFISTELHKSFPALFNAKVLEDAKTEIFKPILQDKLHFVENHLKNKGHLVGNAFTLADPYLFVILGWLPQCNISLDQYPNLKCFFNRINQRTSVQQSLAFE